VCTLAARLCSAASLGAICGLVASSIGPPQFVSFVTQTLLASMENTAAGLSLQMIWRIWLQLFGLVEVSHSSSVRAVNHCFSWIRN
jgi:hypothetical protein